MNGFVGLVIIGLAVYGMAQGGFGGLLTGIVGGIGVGSGVAIALGAKDAGMASSGPVRVAQRIGGLTVALTCLYAVMHGGWHWGWLWGLGGYIGALLCAVAMSAAAERFVRRPGRD